MYILIHIEVQGQYDVHFEKRMFVYHYRIVDLRDHPVVSLAILSDDRPSWRPNQYNNELWGCRVTLDFPMVKLLDYNDKFDELENDLNPFAVVVMAHLQTQMTRRKLQERYAAKFHLITKVLYQRGYKRPDIVALYRFIDWMLHLPKELEQKLRLELDAFDTEKKMRYVTSFERLAMEEGEQKNARKFIVTALETRFGRVSEAIVEAINQVEDMDELESLLRIAIVTSSLTDFQTTLSA